MESVCKLILKDIEWRKMYLPLEIESLSLAFKSERIYLYGHDKLKNPCIYIKPYSKLGEFYPKGSILTLNDFLLYLVYWFENIGQYLLNLGFNTTYTLLIDLSNKPILLADLEQIYCFSQEHFPMKLSKVHLVNLNNKDSSVKNWNFFKENPMFKSVKLSNYFLDNQSARWVF